MATNDERRRVAANLRELAPGSDWPMAVAVACGMDTARMSGNFHEFTGQLCQRLVDLIDPDTTKDTTKTAEATPNCDRDALLKLANRIQHHADNAAGHSAYAARFDLAGWAEVIREACGETQDD